MKLTILNKKKLKYLNLNKYYNKQKDNLYKIKIYIQIN